MPVRTKTPPPVPTLVKAHLQPEMNDRVRRIAFEERTTIQELVREGLQHVIQKRARKVAP